MKKGMLLIAAAAVVLAGGILFFVNRSDRYCQVAPTDFI